MFMYVSVALTIYNGGWDHETPPQTIFFMSDMHGNEGVVNIVVGACDEDEILGSRPAHFSFCLPSCE